MFTQPFPFPHSKLQAHQVALEMAVATKALADHIPRGYRSIAEQMQRASGALVLLIGEGANRYSAGAQ